MLTEIRTYAHDLYEGESARGRTFRYGLLAFDIATIMFIVVTSFLPRTPIVVGIELIFGLILIADLVARISLMERPLRDAFSLATAIDVVVIFSLLAPLGSEGAAFLRVLRTLRLLTTYKILIRLREDFGFFRRNEEVIIAVTHLFVFIFVMTGIVYETQHWTNPAIKNYIDSLYFTVTALTTTGFGDITLQGTSGRLISVVIMIFGVTLFLRLAQVLFRPHKVRFSCPACGLQRHDPDAVHCKACGIVLNIPDEGE